MYEIKNKDTDNYINIGTRGEQQNFFAMPSHFLRN